MEFRINIVDPLNTDNNMGGKNTDIKAFTTLLRKVYIGLHTPHSGSTLDYLLALVELS